jgi:hypothetical protein
MWQQLAIQAGVALLSATFNLLNRDTKGKTEPAPSYEALGQLDVPVVDESSVIPAVFGTVDLISPNVVNFGKLERAQSPFEGEGEGRLRTAYHYVWCYGPVDEISRIRYGGEPLRTIASPSPTIDFSGGSKVTEEVYLGDESRSSMYQSSGAYNGTAIIDFYDGQQSSFSSRGIPVSGDASNVDYIGVVSTVAEKYHGDQVGPRNLAIRVKRTTARSFGDSAWYSSKAEIGDGHMNPAHMIREVRTDEAWGMGKDTSTINDTSFTAAADQLDTEGLGLSTVLTDETTAREFEQEILRHIGGVTYTEPSTGETHLSLIRASDTSQATLDDGNVIKVDSFSRPSLEELPTQVDAVYRGRDVDRDRKMSIHDNAAGFSRPQTAITQRYPMATDPAIVEQIAARDMIEATRPLARVRLTAQREAAADLRPGDKFTFANEEMGISSMSLRVTSISQGPVGATAVGIDAIQDAFDFGTSIYETPGDSVWNDPTNAPQDPNLQAYEVPIWLQWNFFVRGIPTASLTDYASQEDSRLAVVAESPTTDATAYQMYSDGRVVDPDVAFRPVLSLDTDVSQSFQDTGVSFGPTDAPLDESSDYLGLLTDGSETELVEVTSIDLTAGTLTLNRGWGDDRPKINTYSSATLWLLGRFYTAGTELRLTPFGGYDLQRYPSGSGVDIKALTKTDVGTLLPQNATADTVTPTKRVARPYCPARLEVTDNSNTSFTGQVDLTWLHRRRFDEPKTDADTGSDTLETNVTYTVEVYEKSGDLIHTEPDLTGESWSYPNEDEVADRTEACLSERLRFELYAVYDDGSTVLNSHATYIKQIAREPADTGC